MSHVCQLAQRQAVTCDRKRKKSKKKKKTSKAKKIRSKAKSEAQNKLRKRRRTTATKTKREEIEIQIPAERGRENAINNEKGDPEVEARDEVDSDTHNAELHAELAEESSAGGALQALKLLTLKVPPLFSSLASNLSAPMQEKRCQLKVSNAEKRCRLKE